MKYRHIGVSHEYKAPELTVTTLETESGMVLCASSDFEDILNLDPDFEF